MNKVTIEITMDDNDTNISVKNPSGDKSNPAYQSALMMVYLFCDQVDNYSLIEQNLHFTPKICQEMYEMLEHIEDVLDDSSGCGEISVEEIRKLLKKARGEE